MVKTGSSYLSQSELPLTFGLGKPEGGKTVSLKVVWPSGQQESMANIKPNQFITLQEGKGIVSARPIVFTPFCLRRAQRKAHRRSSQLLLQTSSAMISPSMPKSSTPMTARCPTTLHPTFPM